MKRSNQLIIESIVIAAILFGVLFAGSISTSSLPKVWVSIQNPQAVPSRSNLTSIALFYNDTLTSLSSYQYQSVSASLGAFDFLVIPSSINSTAQTANGEIASINVTLPTALFYLNQTSSFYNAGQYANASITLSSFCSNIQSANNSLYQFSGPTTAALNSEGVPVSLYNPPVTVLQNEINSYLQTCQYYKAKLASGVLTTLTITPDQTPLSPYGTLYVYTGGVLNLTSILTKNNLGVGGQVVTFHIAGQGTSPANLTTGSRGSVYGSLTIPYLYTSYVSVWATVDANATSGTPFVVSNVLNMTLLYKQTQIIIQDPPQVLPTFPFSVTGTLRDNSTGIVLPNAPVRITSFNSSYLVTTNNLGIFKDNLTVPANATDGLHYIYAAFAPQGQFGPSVNFTSIIVYRLPITLRVNRPGLVFPGFPSTLSGSVTSNGSALANSRIDLSTPWGIYNTTSDSSGRFSVPLSVPLTEFAFNKQVSVSAIPSEPYYFAASSNVLLSLLNFITIAIIASICGFGYYEARNLGVRLPRIPRIRLKKGQQAQTETRAKVDFAPTVVHPSVVQSAKLRSKLVNSYLEALSLASKKLGIEFHDNMTIRETIALVAAHDNGNGSKLFHNLAITTEDQLYSERQKISTVNDSTIDEWLAELRALW